MATSGDLPGTLGSEPLADHPSDVIYQGGRTRVFRARRDGARLVCKQSLGPDSATRIRHELAILTRLSGVAGVPQLAAPDPAGHVIAMADPGGTVLTAEMAQLRRDLPALIGFAGQLAAVVATVHARGVVHRDINPSNIVVAAEGRPVVIDFDLATTFAEELPGFTHQSTIAGTLPYLAPEQTGRTGWPVDQRADLYALGATLYELVAGQPPFVEADPLHLVHAHLARTPTPPIAPDTETSRLLSEIILRLLEKEPDRRYQSAEGLAHDLARLRAVATGAAPFALGERDFALRLSPPSRLVGREPEVAALLGGLRDAMDGRCGAALIAGGSGVGKTKLINDLRPAVTAAGGWFVLGKFDQYRQDHDSDAVRQALRNLGRLLLAEPGVELGGISARILAALGPNAGLIASRFPEFAALLQVAAEPADQDPTKLESRLITACTDLIRAIASPDRPVVMVLDDLQWAGPFAIGLIDALLLDDGLRGLLLVGAYRDNEVDSAHPLTVAMARWDRLGVAPPLLRLANLPEPQLVTFLRDMFRLPVVRATELAAAVSSRTGGNPFDTVEFVNALRQDGALVLADEGWHWDATALRRHVGRTDVVELLIARIGALPAGSAELLEIMACLGGEVETGLLAVGSGLTREALHERLTPALEDGLLVMDNTGPAAVRFRHDRVQQAAYRRLAGARQPARHLELARRLAVLPGFETLAAEQYLPAVQQVDDPAEARRVATLFRVAAEHLRLINGALAERLLAAAIGLLTGQTDPAAPAEPARPQLTVPAGPAEPAEPARPQLVAPAADADLAELETAWHLALYGLGRLAEADEVYRSLCARVRHPLDLVEPTCYQMLSLTNRDRHDESMALGLGLLERLGLVRQDEDAAALATRVAALARWVRDAGGTEELRAEVDDPLIVGMGKIFDKILATAYFHDGPAFKWVVLEAQRLWIEHGPCASLMGALARTPLLFIGLEHDFHTGHAAARYLISVAEARGYDIALLRLRFIFSSYVVQWFEPVEDAVAQSRLAREGLSYAGDMQYACYSFIPSVAALLDAAPDLSTWGEDVDAALGLATRTGNALTVAILLPQRQLLRSLRGETNIPGGFDDDAFNDATHLASVRSGGSAAELVEYHTYRALCAVLFNDTATLDRNSAAAFEVRDGAPGYYAISLVRLVHALSLAGRARRATAGEKRDRLLAEFAVCRDWLALRAADAPANFGHLVHLIDAERAAATGDTLAALSAYDTALREVATRQRAWHAALISERAGRFHLDHALVHTGRALLGEALDRYAAWGATAKVEALRREYAFLRGTGPTRHVGSTRASTTVSTDEVDLVAVLNASRTLSSETNLDQLRSRVVEVLSAITGATTVQVVLWDEDAAGWYLPAPVGTAGAGMPVDEAGARGMLPLTAFRYAERTREPLLVEDAVRDDRFSRDPYLASLTCCSLLVVPILVHGAPRAVLLLENRLSRGAFSADRLDTVTLIAGQLAVSLDNALLYASLERKVAARTEALEAANERLEVLTITDPLTGLANRRRLTEVLESEWLRSGRTGRPIGVAVVDIDHFKLYNDHYGHVVADACLQRIASTMAANVRSFDLVARYGGEEFVIVLPETDLAVAHAATERVRQAIADLQEPHARTTTGHVTVSVGIAVTVAAEGSSADQLLKAADAELYEAKRQGRDRVCGGPPPVPVSDGPHR